MAWRRYLIRWAGGASPPAGPWQPGAGGAGGGASGAGGQGPGGAGAGQGRGAGPGPGGAQGGGQQPDLGAAVIQQVLAQDQPAGQAAAALARYRAAVAALQDPKARRKGEELGAALQEMEQQPIPAPLGSALALLQALLQGCEDVIFRGVLIGGQRRAALLFTDGMVSAERVEEGVLKPLIQWGDPDRMPQDPDGLRTWLESVAVAASDTKSVYTVGEAVKAVLGGDCLLLVDGCPHGVKLAARGWEQRAITEPVAESVIRGPREGFIENLRVNTALLRRKLQTPHLKLERLILGRRTRTTVVIAYLQDVANPELVAEVRRRLQRIDVDGIVDLGQIEELIEDQPTSVFPQMANTERPDRVAGALLDGQVAVLADGSPFALLMPVTFWTLLTASEDYYERFWIGSLLRWLRYLFLVISLVGPSLYIAVTTFHQEMLPTPLLLSIAAAREGIPFPALVEALLMEVFFEALREAGVRLPRPVGQAVSIVGALVIGEAAVRAGLASAPVVIIVATTGIASFTFPRFDLGIAFRILRFPMIFLAGSLGLFGIMVGLVAILVHLCALRSFGVPYLQPVAPFTWQDIKDVVARMPMWLAGHRPKAFAPINRRRQAPWLKPGPEGTR